MDEHTPRHEDDLSDCERRLAAWRPDAAGLDADAMLFAAGQAAGRPGRGRLLWPVLCVVLALQAAALGVWGLAERAEHRALASLLREQSPAPDAPAAAVELASEPAYTPSPEDYYHLRRRAEQDAGHWLASLSPAATREPGPALPGSPVFRAGQRDGLPDF